MQISIEELKKLRDDIIKYGIYLEKETYHPYLEVQQFGNRLTEIIDNIKYE